MYRTYNVRPLPRPAKQPTSRLPLALAVVAALLLVAYCGYALFRPVSSVHITITPPVIPAMVKVSIPWPTTAAHEQSAFGADGYGLLAQNPATGAPAPLPTASVAKVITALVVLSKKPLVSGEQGPPITLTAHDVDLYNQYVAQDGSVVPISAGETISEYQALQALMLPSANNIADTLAIWAFGDMVSYNSFANSYVRTFGMTNTTVTDASGFADTTVSTAADLVKLGDKAVDNPVLAEIFNQKTADFPNYGPIRNVNGLLGQSGIRGIKTGNTDAAGGVFLGAADVLIGGKTITVITAVMGAPDLASALRGTLPLVQAAPSEFQTAKVVTAGQVVGKANTIWGASSNIQASKNITVTAWSGTSVAPLGTTTGVNAPAVAGSKVGNLSLKFNGVEQDSGLTLTNPIGKPGLWWRLRHPL